VSGKRPLNMAVLPIIEVADIAAGATISNTKGVLPSTTVTVISEVSAGQTGCVETNVKLLGSFRGSMVLGLQMLNY